MTRSRLADSQTRPPSKSRNTESSSRLSLASQTKVHLPALASHGSTSQAVVRGLPLSVLIGHCVGIITRARRRSDASQQRPSLSSNRAPGACRLAANVEPGAGGMWMRRGYIPRTLTGGLSGPSLTRADRTPERVATKRPIARAVATCRTVDAHSRPRGGVADGALRRSRRAPRPKRLRLPLPRSLSRVASPVEVARHFSSDSAASWSGSPAPACPGGDKGKCRGRAQRHLLLDLSGSPGSGQSVVTRAKRRIQVVTVHACRPKEVVDFR